MNENFHARSTKNEKKMKKNQRAVGHTLLRIKIEAQLRRLYVCCVCLLCVCVCDLRRRVERERGGGGSE